MRKNVLITGGADEIHRVLMTCDTVGGVWTFALEPARGLTQSGKEVLLASLGAIPSPAQEAAALGIPNPNHVSRDFKLEWMEEPWGEVAASARWTERLAREYSPDLDHLNSFGHGGVGFRCPVLLTTHSCVPGAKTSVVFYAGRLRDEAKNAEALAQIAPSLSCPVYSSGEGSVEGCRSLGWSAGEEIAQWCSKAAIYASPARYETFGHAHFPRGMLSNTVQRSAIGRAAHRRVLAHHTYAHRALEIERALEGRTALAGAIL